MCYSLSLELHCCWYCHSKNCFFVDLLRPLMTVFKNRTTKAQEEGSRRGENRKLKGFRKIVARTGFSQPLQSLPACLCYSLRQLKNIELHKIFPMSMAGGCIVCKWHLNCWVSIVKQRWDWGRAQLGSVGL